MIEAPAPTSREVRVSDANEAGSWDGILGPDEQIEWQGAPAQGLRWELGRRETTGAVALAAAGVTLVAFAYRPSDTDLGNPVLVLAAWAIIAAIGSHGWSVWNRRRTFYTLTNKRVFVATWHFGVQTLRA